MMFQLLHRRRKRSRKIRHFAKGLNYSAQRRLLRLLLILLCIVLTHTFVISYIEKISLWTAFWLTLTTMTTVGYGDVSAQSVTGQLFTIVLIYIFGIWLLAQLVGEYIDFRIDRRDKMLKGHWRWKKMQDHLLIINTPTHDRDRYLARLVEQMQNTPELADLPVQLLTRAYADGLPQSLMDMGVVHYRGSIEEPDTLTAVNIESAKYVLILAEDSANSRSDCLTLDILDRLKHIEHKAYVLVECVQDENKSRFLEMQASAVMRPIRAYPEIVVRALAAPGVEQILENIFRHQGDTTYRYDMSIEDSQWKEVVCQLMNADLGTPLGFVDKDGGVITNPPANTQLSCKAIILLVREEAVPSNDQIKQALSTVATCN